MEINEADVGPAIYSMLMLAIAQRVKGESKYKVLIENANLTSRDLIQHAREEMVDGAVYLTELQDVVDKEIHRCRAEAAYGLIRELECVMESVKDREPQFQLYALQNWMMSFEVITADARRSFRMYVQPSVFEEWDRRGDNLLTLSRSRSFPFTQQLELHL